MLFIVLQTKYVSAAAMAANWIKETAQSTRAVASMMPQSLQLESAFLQLPFEIRLIIYEALLCNKASLDYSIYVDCRASDAGEGKALFTTTESRGLPLMGVSGQILLACRLCNYEGSPILYRDRVVRAKGERVPYLLKRLVNSRGLSYIKTLSISSSEFGENEALNLYPLMLQRLERLQRFDFAPTVATKSIVGCQAATFHWKCTTLIPCRRHIMQTKEYVLRLAAVVMSSHPYLSVLVGSRKAILPVYSLIKDDSQLYDEVSLFRYSSWDTITRETLPEIEEKLAKTETGWTEDRDRFTTRQAL